MLTTQDYTKMTPWYSKHNCTTADIFKYKKTRVQLQRSINVRKHVYNCKSINVRKHVNKLQRSINVRKHVYNCRYM